MGYKKLTVADLVKKKKVLNGVDQKELYIERLDGTITVKKPDIDLIMETSEMDDTLKASKQLVYSCVVEPNLKDQVLQAEYGCAEPYDIVFKLFDLGEVNGIAEELFAMSGINSKVEVVDKLKK